MNLLIDECLDRRLTRHFAGHSAQSVGQAGWASYSNGELLALAVTRFDAFITFDRNLPHQQNLSKYPLIVIVLRARTNKLADLAPLVPRIPTALLTAPKGAATVIGP